VLTQLKLVTALATGC